MTGTVGERLKNTDASTIRDCGADFDKFDTRAFTGTSAS
jgi:hypothetical protein